MRLRITHIYKNIKIIRDFHIISQTARKPKNQKRKNELKNIWKMS
jgi:hypothetical protein